MLFRSGTVLLKYVSEMEGLMKEAIQELEDLDCLEAGRLVLCTSDTTGCYRLPAILKSFQDRYPGIRSEERRVGKECRSRWSPYH